ncbi:MAG: ABC transporter permease subunit, partial [Myxococcota bacterium]
MRIALVLAALALALAVGLPLALLLAALAGDPGALATLVEPRSIESLVNTVVLAVGTTALAVSLGVPLGVLVARTDLPGVRWLSALALVPYVVPPYVTAIAWIALANPTNGWVNLGLRALGLPVVDVYTLGGMIWVLGLESAPVVMLATIDALGRIDASLEEQARVSGAGPLGVLRRVTLPLVAPAVAVSASFVFAGAAAAFGVPYLLATGSADPSFVLTTRIAQALDLDPSTGRPAAIAASLVLVAVS